MPFLFSSRLFIASCVYLPVRVSLHVLKANYRVSFFAMNISKTKQTAKYAYYRLFGTSHFIHEHVGGG